jgi:uncharacterized membrane protein
LGLLGLFAFVAIIMGPLAFFMMWGLRPRVQRLEEQRQSRLTAIEQRLGKLEEKFAVETSPAPTPAPVAPGATSSPQEPAATGPAEDVATPPSTVPDTTLAMGALSQFRQNRLRPSSRTAVPESTTQDPASEVDLPGPAPQLVPQRDAQIGGIGEPETPHASAEAVGEIATPPRETGPTPSETPAVEITRTSLEEAIGTRWTVWVGGLALALGAILLVRYSIERGFFGPGVRVTLGFVLAVALIGAGEFLRRRDDRPAVDVKVAYIPGMLTATGTVAAFGTIYAAYALYHFIGPSAAFLALGVTGLACMAAAALHGPALAGLGLAGSLVTPLLVSTAQPSAWPVVIYVGVVGAVAYGLARLQGWLWLSLAAAGGAGAWAVLLLNGIGLGFFPAAMAHIVLQTALAAFFLALQRLAAVPDEDCKADFVNDVVLGSAAVLTMAALFAGSITAHFGLAWLLGAAAVTASLALTAVRVAAAASAIAGAGLLVLATLTFWPPLAGSHPIPSLILSVVAMLPPDELVWFAGVALLGSAGVAILAGDRLLRGTHLPFRPAACYAGAAALTPIGALSIVYLRLSQGEASWTLAAIAAAVALAFAAAARVFFRTRPTDPGQPILLGLGALASAAVSAIALALVFALEGGLLTVALALAAAGTAFVSVHLGVAALRWCVAAFGVLVAARLAWDPRIVGADLSPTPIFNWLLFGYGVPAISFGLAGRLLRSRGDDVPVRVADSLAVLFAAFLVFFEIRHAMNGGDPYARGSGLVEQGLMAVSSFGFGIVLTRLDAARANVVFRLASLAAGAVGLAVAAVGLGLRWNPLLVRQPVEGGPILNALALGYFLPGILAGLLALAARHTRPVWYWAGAGAASLALVLAFLLLETRMLFRGPVISLDRGASLAELGVDTTICLVVATGIARALAKSGSTFLLQAFIVVAALSAIICAHGTGLLYNPLLRPDPVAGGAILNSLIPGYLLPALAAAALARLAYRSRLEYAAGAAAAALVLGLAYVTLAVRVIFQGPSIEASRGAGIAELGVDTTIFLVVAIALMHAAERRRAQALLLGAMATTALPLAVGLIGLGFLANPLRTGEVVAGGFVLNTLLVGYGLPAALTFVLARQANRGEGMPIPPAFRLATTIAAIAWLFTLVTLETRRIFQGADLSYLRPTSEGEWYAYSAVWLVLGVALLAYGLWRRSTTIRLVSAVFVFASVAKVFLFDLAGLEGILRAASFIGLGLALIGIGLAYQKLVFAERRVG